MPWAAQKGLRGNGTPWRESSDRPHLVAKAPSERSLGATHSEVWLHRSFLFKQTFEKTADGKAKLQSTPVFLTVGQECRDQGPDIVKRPLMMMLQASARGVSEGWNFQMILILIQNINYLQQLAS